MGSPTNFYESISPTILTSLIFGIFPLYPSKFKDGTRHLNSSKHLQLITVVQMTIYTTLLATAVIQRTSGVLSGTYYKGYKVSNVGMTFEFAGGVVYIYAAYICSFFNTGRVKESLETLCCVDTTLMKFGVRFRYARDSLYQMALLMSGMGGIFLLVNLQKLNTIREGLPQLSAVVWLAFVLPVIVTNMMNSQFAFSALALRNRFKMINQQLRRLKEHAVNGGFVVDYGFYVPNAKQYEVNSSGVLRKIDQLQRLHDILCDVSWKINRNYNAQILISIFVQYGTLLFAFFYTYWMFAIRPRSSIYWLCWAVIKVCEILHITVACHTASLQASNTAKEVHKLLLLNWNRSVMEKMIAFSRQLAYRNVVFTICGLFPIDGTLIFTMVSAATTFIAIMIQFQETASPTTCFVNITRQTVAEYGMTL